MLIIHSITKSSIVEIVREEAVCFARNSWQREEGRGRRVVNKSRIYMVGVVYKGCLQ